MKKIIYILTTLLLILSVITGCGSATEQQQETKNESKGAEGQEKGTLIMATSADYPPFEYHELVNGQDEIVGFDVDLAKAIAEKLGYELEIKDQSFDGLIPALQAERVDFVIAGMQATEERKKSVDFSDTYYKGDQAIVYKKETNITGPADLHGKKVAAQLGTTSEEAAKTIEGIELVPLNKLNEIVMEVKNERVYAAVFSETVAKAYIAQNPDLTYVALATEQEAGNAIAFPKGSPLVTDFNQVLQEMKENGELDTLIQKWFQ
jgi:ABC-type amino acid transport substrate-binding protein